MMPHALAAAARHARRCWHAVLAILTLFPVRLWAQAPVAAAPPPTPSNLPPVTIRSVDRVLRATLTAEAGPMTMGGQTWSAMLYNGAFLPPVLRVSPGDSLSLHLVNRLGVSQQTNLHYHGTAVSPKSPGDNVMTIVEPSTTYDYQLHFPTSHDRGLFWYHPHPHGMSEKQVQDGMSGLLIVEGFLEQHYPWLRDVPERLLMLKDPEPPGWPDSLGHRKVVNGDPLAQFTIRPGELQFWRVGNIGADAYFNLKVAGHRMWLLASDANALRKPLLVDSLFLPPGARMEVLIEGGAPGRYPIMHGGVDTGPSGDPNPTQPLGALVVAGAPVDRRADVARLRGMTALPDVVAEIDALRAHPVTRRRTFVFSESPDGNTFYINGRGFAMDSVDTRVQVGDVEEWTLINTSAEWHAFHIHQLDFLVTDIDGVPQPMHSLHDTVNLPFASGNQPSVVKILVPFTDPEIIGRFVYHCHILEHEDGGMMQIIQVDPAGTRPAATPPATSPAGRRGHAGHRGSPVHR